MVKKSFGILLIGLIIFSVVINFGIVSSADSNAGTGWIKSVSNWVQENLIASFGDSATQSLFILIMIIILIYSSLGVADFPENAGMRFLIASATGLLVISVLGDSIAGMMQSFQALGAVFVIGIPILIMTFFTFAVTIKGHFMGVVAQRILWLIYSVYLFFKSAVVWAYLKFGAGTTLGDVFNKWFNLNVGQYADKDNFGLFIQMIVSIAIFWLFFVKNEAITKWMRDSAFMASMGTIRDDLRKSQALRKAEAEAVENSSKKHS